MAGAVSDSGDREGMGQAILALVALPSQQRTQVCKQNSQSTPSDEQFGGNKAVRVCVCVGGCVGMTLPSR